MTRVPVRSLLTLLLALGVTAAVLVWLRELGGPEAVRARFGARAVLVSFPAHVITTLTPLGEIVPFGVANGAAYGVAWGAGLNLAAWMVAAALQYAFGRGAAAEVNRRSLPGWLGRVPLTHPVALVAGRWLPGGGPLVDAAAGAAGVPFSRAMALAALGHVPQAVVIAAVGAGLLRAFG